MNLKSVFQFLILALVLTALQACSDGAGMFTQNGGGVNPNPTPSPITDKSCVLTYTLIANFPLVDPATTPIDQTFYLQTADTALVLSDSDCPFVVENQFLAFPFAIGRYLTKSLDLFATFFWTNPLWGTVTTVSSTEIDFSFDYPATPWVNNPPCILSSHVADGNMRPDDLGTGYIVTGTVPVVISNTANIENCEGVIPDDGSPLFFN